MTADFIAAEACRRFLHDAAIIALWGGFGYLAALVPAGLGCEIGRRLAPLRVIAILVAAATTLARLPFAAAMIGGGWAHALDPAILWPLLTQTNIGTGWLAELGAAVLLVATLALRPPLGQRATALAAGLMIVCLSLGGHAVMREGGTGVLLMANDALHVLAGGAWLGALVPLVMVLKRIGKPSDGPALTALMRFSVVGHVAVALTVLTGIANSLLIVGGLPLDWAVPYQAMLSAKIALVLVMIGLASRNRYVHTPRIGTDATAAAGAVQVGTLREIGLGAAVIGLVAVFGLFDPI